MVVGAVAAAGDTIEGDVGQQWHIQTECCNDLITTVLGHCVAAQQLPPTTKLLHGLLQLQLHSSCHPQHAAAYRIPAWRKLVQLTLVRWEGCCLLKRQVLTRSG
jgi:hypothetical protein